MSPMKILSPAKINLFLQVTFHLFSVIFVSEHVVGVLRFWIRDIGNILLKREEMCAGRLEAPIHGVVIINADANLVGLERLDTELCHININLNRIEIRTIFSRDEI